MIMPRYFLIPGWQETPEIKSALEKFSAIAGANDGMPLTSEQVTEFAASLDANSDGKVCTIISLRTPTRKSESPIQLNHDRAMQITVDDFWLLLLAGSPFTTVEEMEADLNSRESEIDETLPEVRSQLTAALA
jgi:hypothetical protein